MPFTKFTNLDFDQIKTQIKSYLRANSDFKDFDFEGSNIKKYVGGTDDVYKRHADVASIDTSQRFVAMLFYLNDDLMELGNN